MGRRLDATPEQNMNTWVARQSVSRLRDLLFDIELLR
jgi:hypothetical protein